MAELKQIVDGQAACLAKIEKPQALNDLESILDYCDGVMVARGDLGVEMDPEEVPVAQKKILRAARQRGVPAIVATQML
ncbi:pyruvate kinase, partial [Klebsiella pneumoniae]|nr:pyruvate kinase [Klebsiella pneumoniae]